MPLGIGQVGVDLGRVGHGQVQADQAEPGPPAGDHGTEAPRGQHHGRQRLDHDGHDGEQHGHVTEGQRQGHVADQAREGLQVAGVRLDQRPPRPLVVGVGVPVPTVLGPQRRVEQGTGAAGDDGGDGGHEHHRQEPPVGPGRGGPTGTGHRPRPGAPGSPVRGLHGGGLHGGGHRDGSAVPPGPAPSVACGSVSPSTSAMMPRRTLPVAVRGTASTDRYRFGRL